MAVVKEKKAARQTAGKTQVTCTAKKEVSDKPARADSIVTARVPSEIKEQGERRAQEDRLHAYRAGERRIQVRA